MALRVKKKYLVIFVVVLAVLLAIAVTIVLLRKQEAQNPVDTAIHSADSATQKGDYNQALHTLQQAQSQATTNEEKTAILNDLAAAAANAGQLQQALDYYGQKHQLDPSSAAGDGLLVGELYERTGNMQRAIASYKQYLEYLQNLPDDEFTQAKIESMTERIRALEGGQQ